MQHASVRQRRHAVVQAALHDKGSSRTAAVRSVAAPRTVQPTQRRAPPSASSQMLERFSKVWMLRLLQQQDDLQETYTKVAQLSERLATEVTSYKAKIANVVQGILVPTQVVPENKRLLSRSVVQPPQLDLSVLDLEGPDTTDSNGSSGSGDSATPEAQLAALVDSIQDTNNRVREVDSMYLTTNTTIVQLQEGADERDMIQEEVASELLQYADELEQRERQQAAAMAAWEAEQAAIAAKQAAYEAEQARIAEQEAQARRAAEAAAAAAEAGRRVAAHLAELSKPVATTIKVDLGVRKQTKLGQEVVLVGSHPLMGSWDVTKALRLTWSDGHVWRASLELPPDSGALEYKAVLVRSNGPAVWEKGDNHTAELQGSKDVSLFHVFEA